MADPPYLQALKGEWGMMKLGIFRDYHAKYMVKPKFKPVIHIIAFVMCLGYALEYPHLRRTRDALSRAARLRRGARRHAHALKPRRMLPQRQPCARGLRLACCCCPACYAPAWCSLPRSRPSRAALASLR